MLCRALLHFPQANPVDPVASWRNCLCYRNCLSKELFTVHLTAPVFSSSSSLVSTLFFIFLFVYSTYFCLCLYSLVSVLFHFCFHCLVHFVVSFPAFVCIFVGFVWIIQIMNSGLSCFMLFHHRISSIFQYVYFTSMTFKSDYSNSLPLLVQCLILFSIPSTMFVVIVVVVCSIRASY